MKKKSRSEINNTPVAQEQIQPTNEIPAVFKRFEGKTPVQVLGAMYPHVKPEALGAMMCGLGLDLGVPIPEWVKKASRQFWKYYFGKVVDMSNSIEDQGALASLMEEMTKGIVGQKPTEPQHPVEVVLREFGNPAASALEKDARGKSREETAKFFAGRVRGGEAFEKMKNTEYLKMVKRAPIYFCLCFFWLKFEAFASQAEAERWLRAENWIDDRVSSREVSAVLTGVGLRYRGPGRPKKQKN